MNLQIISDDMVGENTMDFLEDLNRQTVVLNCGHRVQWSELFIREIHILRGFEIHVICSICGR